MVPPRDRGDGGHPSCQQRVVWGAACVGLVGCPRPALWHFWARGPHAAPLIAPVCPRSAWVFPQPCPKRWRGPGRRIGRLQSDGRVSGRQVRILMVVEGWVPHLMAKHPFLGVPGKAVPVPVPRPHPLYQGSCPQTSGCGFVPENRCSRSDVASGSQTTARPLHPSRLARSPAGSCWGPPERSCGQPAPLHHLRLVQRLGAESGFPVNAAGSGVGHGISKKTPQ